MPSGSETDRAPCFRQNEHWQARTLICRGSIWLSRVILILPQWQPPACLKFLPLPPRKSFSQRIMTMPVAWQLVRELHQCLIAKTQSAGDSMYPINGVLSRQNGLDRAQDRRLGCGGEGVGGGREVCLFNVANLGLVVRRRHDHEQNCTDEVKPQQSHKHCLIPRSISASSFHRLSSG